MSRTGDFAKCLEVCHLMLDATHKWA
ncbi:hypothetical protein F3J19_12700 [Burkholderia sp. Ax-1724]|nr:hypothetical protein [Burkholderia sp. Ax-1724]NIF76339.1 hypothetical protein [Paraburkholderia sp. Cy-641]